LKAPSCPAIDSHTHLTYHHERPTSGSWSWESVSYHLYAGRNAACPPPASPPSAMAAAAASSVGRATRCARADSLEVGRGPIICGGGTAGRHACLDGQRNATSLGMTANGAEGVRAVREQVKGRVDWIKVAASGVAARLSAAPDRRPRLRGNRAAVQEA
jgi:hypothetical protein